MPYEPMSREEKRRLAILALDLQRALLVGSRAPIVDQMWERWRHPEPGDWVIETSTLYGLTHVSGRFDESLWDGQFTRYLREDIVTHINEEDPEDTATERVLVCENPDGTEFRWTNAELAAVPLDQSLVVDPVRFPVGE